MIHALHNLLILLIHRPDRLPWLAAHAWHWHPVACSLTAAGIAIEAYLCRRLWRLHRSHR